MSDKKKIWESEFKFNRRLAKKYDLDFDEACVFDEQLKPFGGYPKDGQMRKIKMLSGKTAEYKCVLTKIWPGCTGQKSWRYEFQGYLPSKPIDS